MDLSQIAAMAPPPGVVPNFVDPVSLAPVCLIVIAITLPLMVIFLALRFYARLRFQAIGADDSQSDPFEPAWIHVTVGAFADCRVLCE